MDYEKMDTDEGEIPLVGAEIEIQTETGNTGNEDNYETRCNESVEGAVGPAIIPSTTSTLTASKEQRTYYSLYGQHPA